MTKSKSSKVMLAIAQRLKDIAVEPKYLSEEQWENFLSGSHTMIVVFKEKEDCTMQTISLLRRK